jgi:hypothetical protein
MKAKSSRERNVFIGILGVALMGLGVDRVFLGSGATGPAAASAAAAEAFAADPFSDAIDVQFTEPADEPEPLTSALAGRLEDFAQRGQREVGDLPDVFEPSASWRSTSSSDGDGASRPASASEAFQAAHRLTAVMLSDSNPGAVVDGRFLRIGQALDGFILTSVNERSALFKAEHEQAELALDPQPQSP